MDIILNFAGAILGWTAGWLPSSGGIPGEVQQGFTYFLGFQSGWGWIFPFGVFWSLVAAGMVIELLYQAAYFAKWAINWIRGRR